MLIQYTAYLVTLHVTPKVTGPMAGNLFPIECYVYGFENLCRAMMDYMNDGYKVEVSGAANLKRLYWQ